MFNIREFDNEEEDIFEDETDCEPELTDEGKMREKNQRNHFTCYHECAAIIHLPENGISLNMYNICLLIALAVRYSEVADIF